MDTEIENNSSEDVRDLKNEILSKYIVMGRLLLLATLYGVLPSPESMNGVIWSRTQKTFVPISSVPVYAMIQQERLRQSRALEIHNFQQQNLTLTSFQEPHFFQFYDNNTKVTGLCGDIWTMLSESLNFTLQPVKVNVDGMGTPEKDSTYKHGLLGILFHNETIAIPKIEIFTRRLVATDFSIPFRINRHQLYILRDVIYDNTWMIKIFSWKIWCIILIMYVLLSACTFLTQNILAQNEDKYKTVSFSEHLLYNFGNLCNQGYIPNYLHRRSRILEVSLGFFNSIIYMSFGAVLFIYITKNVFIPPFDSFESLVTNTEYSVVSMKGSTGAIAFEIINEEPFIQARMAKRLIVASTIESMHKMACFSKKKTYAIYQGEDAHKVTEHIICHLTQIGEPFTKAWVASGIVKNFKYKRTIDLGILKLMEVGLLSALKDRWLERRIKENYDADKTPQPIEIHQVSLVIAIICCGVIISFIILIIEKIIFVYKLKQL